MQNQNQIKASSEKLAEFIWQNIDEPYIESFLKGLGLQKVNRNGKVYIRKIPERLTGKGLESALVFGLISKENGGIYGKTRYKGEIINLSVADTAKAFKGKRFAEPTTEGDKAISKIKEAIETTEKEDLNSD